jgi:anti-sigma-K factor RskA
VTIDHETIRELAAGSALDDLDADERRAFYAHVATCAACRDLSIDLVDVLGDLALIAPAVHPPSDMRASVMAAVRTSDPAPSASTRSRSADDRGTPGAPEAPAITAIDDVRREARRLRRMTFGAVALAAALGVVAFGIGLRTVELADAVAANTAALARAEARLAEQSSAVALVADPGHVTASLHAEPVAPAAIAVVLYRPGSPDAYLMAHGLPATPPGMVYQLWYADAAGVHPLGTFQHDGEGPLVAPFGVDLASSVAAMVTLEPEGGAQGEPGPEVLFGEL